MDEATRKKIAAKIFEETGIAVDHDDPVFTLATINKESISELIGSISEKVKSIPDELDERLTKRMSEIENLAKKLESSAGEKIKKDAEAAKELFYTSMKKEVGQATRDIQATAERLSSNNTPLGGVVLTALVCSIVAGLSSWGAAYLYNMKNVETLRKEIAFYQLYQQADEVGYLAIGNQFSEKQQNKNDAVYLEAMNKKFKELIEKSDLGNFRPKEFKY
ncbi:hypothetical protein [Aeromonas salmonicida]|uniref:hypothetical protein n=1 Tax=Aeromonas salmonicida TaxID=645 RepID=UPI0030A51BC5